jgi:hypothetical protein
MAGNTADHQRLVKLLLVAFSMPDVRVWPNVVGVFQRIKSDEMIRVGVVGSADISGIYKDGRRIEIEVKTGNAKQSKEQKKWQIMIEKFGGIFILARSVDGALNDFEKML